MAETSIEWTDYTFNPWWGCTAVSPACGLPLPNGELGAGCYAETLDARFPILGQTHWGKDAPRRFFGEKHWDEPRAWNAKARKDGLRKRVFCGSMCDVMEEREDLISWRYSLYGLIEQTPSLDWLLLTKRPQNFRRFLPAAWLENPRPNVWLMTTVETPDYLWRIDALKGCPAVVHGLSIEPLLAPLPTLGEYLDGIDWVICGGQSGKWARPMHPDWARSVRDQCVAVGVPFFFKQWGEWEAGELGPRHTYYSCAHGGVMMTGPSCARHDWGEPDGPVRSVRVGKKAAGRILDGRTWDEMPGVRG